MWIVHIYLAASLCACCRESTVVIGIWAYLGVGANVCDPSTWRVEAEDEKAKESLDDLTPYLKHKPKIRSVCVPMCMCLWVLWPALPLLVLLPWEGLLTKPGARLAAQL